MSFAAVPRFLYPAAPNRDCSSESEGWCIVAKEEDNGMTTEMTHLTIVPSSLSSLVSRHHITQNRPAQNYRRVGRGGSVKIKWDVVDVKKIRSILRR